MTTVPAHSFSAPARAAVIAAARFIPGVWGVFTSSSSACTTRTPRRRQSARPPSAVIAHTRSARTSCGESPTPRRRAPAFEEQTRWRAPAETGTVEVVGWVMIPAQFPGLGWVSFDLAEVMGSVGEWAELDWVVYDTYGGAKASWLPGDPRL